VREKEKQHAYAILKKAAVIANLTDKRLEQKRAPTSVKFLVEGTKPNLKKINECW
jgi:hypothetical protein